MSSTTASTRRPAGAAPNQIVQPGSRADHHAAGKALRQKYPRDAHAAWKAPAKRANAVDKYATVTAESSSRASRARPKSSCCRRAHPRQAEIPSGSGRPGGQGLRPLFPESAHACGARLVGPSPQEQCSTCRRVLRGRRDDPGVANYLPRSARSKGGGTETATRELL